MKAGDIPSTPPVLNFGIILRFAASQMSFTSPVPRVQVERVIGGARVALAASSLFAIWLDPAEPGRYAQLTYSLHAVYVVYSVALTLLMWRRDRVGSWPLVTQVADMAVASVFQYLTLGPSSPFFVYFVFALFSAALRWGARGTIRTAGVILIAFVVMGASLSRTLGPAEFELSRFIIRIAYLLVVASLLTYLAQHEERLRDEVRRLARWPLTIGSNFDRSVATVVEHSAGILRARRVIAVWERTEEPWIYEASWPFDGPSITRHGPDELEPIVPADLTHATFVLSGRPSDNAAIVVSRLGVVSDWTGRPVHPRFDARLGTANLASAPFHNERLSGRVFFGGIPHAGAETMPLVEVVARELGASLEQLYSFQQSRAIAISEDRIRLARDLHDGVLQSLTGIRLEMQALAVHDSTTLPMLARERLKDLERALADEQRALRSFISDLKPADNQRDITSLSHRLQDLRRRIELQWRVQVSMRVALSGVDLSEIVDRSIPLIVHEAIVNALRHAQPSRVAVDVSAGKGLLAIAVEDDGRGFPFTGRRDHEALESSNSGPISLRERVSSLGGRLAIESRPTGSRVELSIPLDAA